MFIAESIPYGKTSSGVVFPFDLRTVEAQLYTKQM